jgi:CAAX prenyl protease-like protein
MTANPESSAAQPEGASASASAKDSRAGRSGEERSPESVGEIVPYLVPMFTYVALSGVETYLPRSDGGPSPSWYPLAYAVKLVVVILLAWCYRSTWRDLRPAPTPPAALLACLAGLLVCAIWVGLDGRYPMFRFLGTRSAFNANVLAPPARWPFIAVRMLGLTLVVPLIEELFWRSFLMRWLIDADFRRVPIGQVTPVAAATTSALFALSHPEWLPALATGLLWAWLLWRTRSVGACFLSHATANLALGIYVMVTGDWKFW